MVLLVVDTVPCAHNCMVTMCCRHFPLQSLFPATHQPPFVLLAQVYQNLLQQTPTKKSVEELKPFLAAVKVRAEV